jgi:hypothetical protein
MPIATYLIVPSLDTVAENQYYSTYYIDNEDFHMTGYPMISVYGDFEEHWTSYFTISAADEQSRYIDRLAIFSTCSALDETTFTFTEIDSDRCYFVAGSTSELWCEGEYDLADNDGEFYFDLPSYEIETYSVGSSDCYGIAAANYYMTSTNSGPIYLDYSTLTMDSPYDHIGETFEVSAQIDFTNPLNPTYIQTLTISGSVTITDSGDNNDDDTGDDDGDDNDDYDSAFNAAQYAYITSSNDPTAFDLTAVLDENLTTTFEATCTGGIAEINVQFAASIPLQTVGIKTDLGDSGSIFARDNAGTEIYCQQQVQLDGFHRCDMWTDHIVFQKYCDSDSVTFNVAEIGAFLYAEAGSWDWIEYGLVDNTDVSLEGLFGNSQSSSGEEGFSYQGSEFFLSFNTPVPVVAWVTVPSPATSDEWLTTEIWETNNDWELYGYPDIGIYNDYGEVMTQNITVHASDSSATRFLHKLGVFSSCNSLDESSWHYTDIGDDCEWWSAEDLFCSREYDLYENGGEFNIYLPYAEMEEFDLSSASCFERLYTLYNEDGSDYTGPLYVDEWGTLLLEGDPYDYVD